MRVPHHLCCFCKLPVLSITDQDVFLDPYCFRDGEEDLKAETEGVAGFAHSVCLKRSPWCDFWQERRIQNLIVERGFSLVSGNAPYIVRDRRNNRVAIIRMDSSIWIDSLPSVVETGEARTVNEVVWDLRGKKEIARFLSRELAQYGRADLAHVIAKFDELCEKKIYNTALVQGMIRPYSDDEKETFSALQEFVFGGETETTVKLASEELTVIATCVTI